VVTNSAIDWLANLLADDGSAIREITPLRLRVLLARAREDDVAYRDLVNRNREMAESLGFVRIGDTVAGYRILRLLGSGGHWIQRRRGGRSPWDRPEVSGP
jgi:hypothetical protein